jgi:hypothetical protein
MKAQEESEQKELNTERRHLVMHYDDEASEFAEYLSKVFTCTTHIHAVA